MHPVRTACLFAILAIPAVLPTAARAETYETCAGFIDSVPATITTQGVWCLRKNLATSITNGAAITIATNNVTIDCNDFKLGGLAGGDGSAAAGIHAEGRQNTTVRHCNVRGFLTGILLTGAGHLVEDNRLDNNLLYGILISGQNNLVQRNRVFDTGGAPSAISSTGIYAVADILDNTVAGGFAIGAANTDAYGIISAADGAEIGGNRVRGLAPTGSGTATGIYVNGVGGKVTGNWVSAEAGTSGWGINGVGAGTACTDNVVAGLSTHYLSCDAVSDNLSL